MAEITLDCKGPGLQISTNISMDDNVNLFKGIPLLKEVNANIRITHFNPSNRGIYYCLGNFSTYSKEQFLLINSGKY